MCRRAFNSGVKRVYLLTNHPTAKTEKYDLDNKLYNEYMRFALAWLPRSVLLIDIEKVFESQSIKGLLKDGIHLNKRGHCTYYKAIRQTLLKGIREELKCSINIHSLHRKH